MDNSLEFLNDEIEELKSKANKNEREMKYLDDRVYSTKMSTPVARIYVCLTSRSSPTQHKRAQKNLFSITWRER